jgi:hypothetical protein
MQYALYKNPRQFGTQGSIESNESKAEKLII